MPPEFGGDDYLKTLRMVVESVESSRAGGRDSTHAHPPPRPKELRFGPEKARPPLRTARRGRGHREGHPRRGPRERRQRPHRSLEPLRQGGFTSAKQLASPPPSSPPPMRGRRDDEEGHRRLAEERHRFREAQPAQGLDREKRPRRPRRRALPALPARRHLRSRRPAPRSSRLRT